MKKLYFVILLSLSLHFAFSQELKVKSFAVAEKDLSARTNVRKDINGNVCGLVKVGLTVKGAKFEGYVVGDVKYESGEYWVYMAEGAKRLKVLNDEYTPLEVEFSNYEIDKLKGNTTYSLTLIKPEVAVLPAYENYKGKPVIKELIKNMVFVKGGSFTMGTNGIKGVQLSPMEKPAHEVSVSDFYIGRYEVSQKEWKAIMGYNNSFFSGSERPVEKVSWDECQLFVKKLSDLTGIKFRLPTDAEWEYAAKGAKESDSHLYSGADLLNDVAWTKSNSNKKTHPRGEKIPNILDLYDMTGNVAEWVQDTYNLRKFSNYISNIENNKLYITRGGDWFNNEESCRNTYKSLVPKGSKGNNIGLRLACTEM